MTNGKFGDYSSMTSTLEEREVSAPLLTSLKGNGRRRYLIVETPLGAIRLQSLTAAELSRVRNFPPEKQYFAAITLSMVDENGDTCYACDHETFEMLADLDGQVYDILTDAINQHVLNTKPLEELVKNCG